MKKALFISIITSSFAGHCIDNSSVNSTITSTYHHILKDYQKGDFSQAKEKLTKLIHSVERPSALTNLGLIEYREGHFGKAIGLWRKALSLNPTLFQAKQALNFAQKQLKIPPPPTKSNFWQYLHNSLFSTTPLYLYLSATAALMLISLPPILAYLGRRKRASLNNLSPVKFPYTGLALFSLFIFSGILSILKILDQQIPRATVIQNQIHVLATAKENSPSIYELFEGQEVIIKRNNAPWTQVQYSGELSGWVKSNSLFQTSGQTSGKKHDK